MESKKYSRREVIKKGALAGAVFSIVPRHVLGRGCVAPSDTLTKAVIGVGGMGQGHLNYPGATLLAICDVDTNHLNNTLAGNNQISRYTDFREVLARDDIDIVHIPTPPHWHGLIAVAAANAGKDIWCEKPMTRTIGEGQAVVEACRRNGTIFRINTWFRFQDNLYGLGRDARFCKKLVNSGALGTPLTVTVGANTGFDWKLSLWSGDSNLSPQSVPSALDYNMWLGPRPWKPYNSNRVHSKFRGYWDYDGGGLGDMGMHYLDPVQYILGKDNESPVEVEADSVAQHPDAVVPWRRVTLTYADGTKIILDGDNTLGDRYIEGPNGYLARGGGSNLDVNAIVSGEPNPPAQVTDFAHAVKNRVKFALNEENGHRSTTLVNIAVIAIQLRRKLQFNSATQRFVNDDEANRLVNPPMRAPWSLEGMGV